MALSPEILELILARHPSTSNNEQARPTRCKIYCYWSPADFEVALCTINKLAYTGLVQSIGAPC